MKKNTISICISTYDRLEGLKKLLDSIDKIILPENFTSDDIKVVIVDNYDGSSIKVVNEIKSSFNFKINWFHENRKGIVYARNKTVEISGYTDFYFFVDDDQILKENCIKEIYKTAIKKNADLVYGNNPPIFEKKYPDEIHHYFNQTPKYDYDYKINYAPTNCTLIKKEVLKNIDGPFDLRFNLTGGEDSHLSRKLLYRKYKLFKSTKAFAPEFIPHSRCNTRWIIYREFRCASSLSFQDVLFSLGFKFYLRRMVKAILKIFIGVTIFPLFMIKFKHRYNPIILISQGLGSIAGYLKIHPEEYK